mmetsp:Transcript_94525/g.282243  ORF Transcript_94525/g.282243 Transcript_94525/m.282243 type:complete len:396 (-) Transcript_94525:135-1322(-)
MMQQRVSGRQPTDKRAPKNPGGGLQVLSNLPEEVDIRYRISFVVIGGDEAKAMVDITCESAYARNLNNKAQAHEAPSVDLRLEQSTLSKAVESFLLQPGMSDLRLEEALSVSPVGLDMRQDTKRVVEAESGEPDLVRRAHKPITVTSASETNSCLCQINRVRGSKTSTSFGPSESLGFHSTGSVTASMVSQASSSRSQGPELVKMGFSIITSFVGELPALTSQKEALSTCFVFCLVVDGQSAADSQIEGHLHVEAFAEQLLNLRRRSSEVVLRTRHSMPDVRPLCAVLLLQLSQESRSRTTSEDWQHRLSEFEAEHGELWKFGPIWLEDGNELHSTFSMISRGMLKQSLAKDRSMSLMPSWTLPGMPSPPAPTERTAGWSLRTLLGRPRRPSPPS